MAITIVTAFFDIGRGSWCEEKGSPSYLERSNEKYFKYFSNLATLENNMIVFTSTEFISKIKSIRGNKPTIVIDVDLKQKFSKCLERISKIQGSREFRQKINPDQLKNPEYWSAEYVLINNLKSYFLKKAIVEIGISTTYAAWVDFGYCRNTKTLNGIRNWDYPFIKNKVHFFSIRKEFEVSKENVSHAILNNQPYIIGGVIVAEPNKWLDFADVIYSCQNEMLNSNIIDDDQGVYLTTLLKRPDLFQINYLGENQWFDTFRIFSNKPPIRFLGLIRRLLRKY